mgnify:CR=1 FL=1
MLKITRKNTLLLGTLILTASGIICRILGFLYRIFLSRRIGAEAFGIYQLATPLYALMLSLGAGGMQTVLSRFVASYLAKKDSRRAKICLAAGCGIVVILSFSASIFLFFSADFIGTRLLFEPRTILLLRILSLGILPSGIHNCLSAWYLGQNQTALPSFCQLLEQFVRMGASYLAWLFCLSTSLPSAAVAAFGTAAGELPVRLAQQVPSETPPDFCFFQRKDPLVRYLPRACRFESSAYAEPYSSECPPQH